MKLKLIFIAYSVISSTLSLNDDFKPYIILPSKGPSICAVGNVDCLQPLADVQRYLTDVFNIERYKVATGYYNKLPIATDMLSLEMDEVLKNKAQAYAETCLFEYNMRHCPQPKGSQDGEITIFLEEYDRSTSVNTESRIERELKVLRSQVARFSNKELEQLVKSYRVSQTEISFHDSAKFIHSEVWKVGCGFADFLVPNNKFKEVIVCFFGPPKLKMGKRLYIAGCIPCSNCPSETSCENRDLPGLCKVNSGKLPVYDKHNKWEKNICLKPDAAILKQPIVNRAAGGDTELDVNMDTGLQQCKGKHLCSVGWKNKRDYAYIEVNETCLSVIVFREKIYIKEESCFTFLYSKNILESSPNSASTIAFAFEENDQGNLQIHEEKHGNSIDFKSIFLDLPWTDAYIHVGFGTLSDSDGEDDDYDIQVKEFKINSGRCLQI